MAPSTSRKMDLPASPAGMSSFLRYQPMPGLGNRPIEPPTPPELNGPSIAQSCGKFTKRQPRSSKPACTYDTLPPGFPSGRTKRFAGSLMNGSPDGRIQGLSTGCVAAESFAASSVASASRALRSSPRETGRTSKSRSCALTFVGSPLVNRQPSSIELLWRAAVGCGSAPADGFSVRTKRERTRLTVPAISSHVILAEEMEGAFMFRLDQC